MDFQRFLLKIQSPSKFNPGLSNLWRGNSFKLLNKTIFNTFRKPSFRNNENQDIVYFRSARAALTSILNAFSIGIEDEIILSSFTCDAVTAAILATGAKPVYVDISIDLTR